MLDYLMAKDMSSWHMGNHTGGDVLDKLINSVDRDGGTTESAPEYNNLWYNSMGRIADYLYGYEGYPAADLHQNPIFCKMLTQQFPLIMCRRATAQLGDSGSTGGLEIHLPYYLYLIQNYRATENPEIAQILYFQNGNTVEGLHETIFTKNPEAIQEDIRKVMDTYGEYAFDKSVLQAGYGFAALRDGSLYGQGSISPHDNQRDFWLKFSKAGTHGHPAALNLGIHAYGLDMAPDLGYPIASDGSDIHINWGFATINHNTVMVNDQKQLRTGSVGTTKHYEDAGRVKLIDVDVPGAYAETDVFRRTVVMVEASDDVSYGVDFFRIRGGDEHLFSFHSQSDTISEIQGFAPVEQGSGSYAGENVPYQASGYENGYSYLKKIRKAEQPKTGEFSVDFEVTDFRKILEDSSGLHLRMTMLNDFELSEITLAEGEPPKRTNNPERLEFVLARRSGKDLDSTFTTVFEPYKGTRYIQSIEQAVVFREDGKPVNQGGDVVRAIQILLEGGRTDYIIYASNNKVKYLIGDEKFPFQGFVGVCTWVDGEMVYAHLSDGSILGNVDGTAAYTGEIVDFTRTLSKENEITVRFDGEVNLQALTGRHIFVENDGVDSGVYPILSAAENKDGTVRLDIGDKRLIRSAQNVTASGGDYTFNIAARQWFTIPLSETVDTGPVFQPVQNLRATANKAFSQYVHAESPSGKALTYHAENLPRGAQFDPESRHFTWTPDQSQLGKHHVAITVSDGALSDTLHFEIEVFSSSSGGAAPDRTSKDEEPKKDEEPEKDREEPVGEQFTDLGGYEWAKESIYKLVELGIVKGTSENTYSPGRDITRADYAILLARAFEVKPAPDVENFADVPADAYYAEELAAAKAAGLVNGVGNNCFDPESAITRQDMMVILYRALKGNGQEFSEATDENLAEFADGAQVAEYAREAAAALVGAGIIAGSGNRLHPQANASRAEVAVMLARIF